MSKSPTVLILSTIEGHQSIAESIESHLNHLNFNTIVHTYPDPILHLYRPVYRHIPQVPLAKIVSRPRLQPLNKLYAKFTHKKTFLREYKLTQPDIIISSNWGFDPAIESLRDQISIPYINIVPDPRSIVPLSLSTTATANCVFDQTQKLYCHQLKPTATTLTAGWFVKPSFKPISDKTKIRNKLNLDPNATTFLFVTGYEGTQNILNIIPRLKSSTPLQLIISCGTNKSLLSKSKKLANRLNHPITLTPLSFTKNLHQYMQASNLVIGKAGPNTIFESVATHTPFFATTHIAGQEDGNLDLIKEYKIGYVEEDSPKTAKLLNQIITSPTNLKKFHPHLTKLAKHNNKANQILTKFITTNLNLKP